jgi:DNA-binding NtrC family response regulator
MKKQTGRLLVVDDNEDVLLAARLLLRQHVELVHTEKDPSNIPWLLGDENYDVILLDMNFTKDVSSGQEGFDWLSRVQEIDPSVVVVLMTAYGDVDIAVRAIKAGASDFVLKPWQNEKLWATISAAVDLRRARSEADGLRQQQKQLSADIDQSFQDFVGACPAMQRVFGVIEKVADTDANVLILGENGTGKELVAREIHRQSGRASDVFISVDVGSISESLFESELFGHVRGAFTDAREDRPGRFEIAAGGTLFLDEIGNIPPAQQSKLLAVLEQRQVTRLGSNSPRAIDIRLISATNMPIHERVADGGFRQDLLFRINTVEIQLPPLRERQEDISLLADHFLAKFARKYRKPIERLGTAARKLLERYHWPGNVRELQHALERAVIMSGASTLRAEDFVLSSVGSSSNNIKLDDYNLEEVERQVILKVLKRYQGNVSQAARELGLTRASLYRRLQKHGL